MMSSTTEDAVKELSGTPYVLPDDGESVVRFNKTHGRCSETSDIAKRAQERIRGRAGQMFGEFAELLRSELVAESNKIEGYDWSTATVKIAADLHRELLSLPLRAFTDGVREDPRVYEALGLYKAHQLAEEWAEQSIVPREVDVRALHSLVAVGESYAGRYKTAENSIQGSDLRTSGPLDVPRHMNELIHWWQTSNAPPVLLATVVHAWLTQIHPFDDGNGRIARLLANMALAQSGYPPLLIKSGQDRGQYLDALNHSDAGNILPLYELFAGVIRRQVRLMANHEYVNEIVGQRLFSDLKARYELWNSAVDSFQSALEQMLARRNWVARFDGRPDVVAFSFLIDAQSDGNGWFCRLGPRYNPVAFLLWWGFESDQMMHARGKEGRTFPSLFLSARSEMGARPYEDSGIEFVVEPLSAWPVSYLDDNGLESIDFAPAATRLLNYCADL